MPPRPSTTRLATRAMVAATTALLGACGTDTPTGSDNGSGGNRAPVAVIVADILSGTVPLTVAFDASASTDDGGGSLSYSWDFGDGSPGASGPSVTHTYDQVGSFTASVRVTDAQGASDDASLSISAQAPVILFPLGLALAQGDYWTFAYRDASASFTGGENTSGADAGFLTLRLGPPTTIGGETLYALEQRSGGSTSETPADADYTVPWTHVGTDADGSLVSSRDGSSLVTLFDVYGGWTGDGFFDGFGGADLEPERTAFENGSIDIQANTTYRVSIEGSSGGCDTFQSPAGPITICDEVSTAGSEAEYFLPGVGPLAYRRNGSAASSSGAATAALTYELIDTSEGALDPYRIARRWEPVASPTLDALTPGGFEHGGELWFYDQYPLQQADFRFDVYDPATDTWTLTAALALGSWCPASSALSRFVTPMGSQFVLICSTGGTYPAALYDPATGGVSFGTSIQPSSGCRYVGRGDMWQGLAAFMRCSIPTFYDPVQDLWYEAASLSASDANVEQARYVGDDIFVLGYTDSHRFDLVGAGSWVAVANMSGATRFGPTFRQPAVVALGGMLYASGGTDGFNASSEVGIDWILEGAARFDPTGGSWAALDPMLLRRTDHALVAVGGALYAIGSSSFNDTRSMERYVP